MNTNNITSNSAPPSGGLRGGVVIEVGGERHRLVKEPIDAKTLTPQCDKCSLFNEDCGLLCTEYVDKSNNSYYFVKENEEFG